MITYLRKVLIICALKASACLVGFMAEWELDSGPLATHGIRIPEQRGAHGYSTKKLGSELGCFCFDLITWDCDLGSPLVFLQCVHGYLLPPATWAPGRCCKHTERKEIGLRPHFWVWHHVPSKVWTESTVHGHAQTKRSFAKVSFQQRTKVIWNLGCVCKMC